MAFVMTRAVGAAPRDIEAEKKLNDLGKMFKNLNVKRLGDTHAKVLAYESNMGSSDKFQLAFLKGSSRQGLSRRARCTPES